MSAGGTQKRIPLWTTALGLALFALAFFWLNHVLAQYRWHDIMKRVYGLPSASLALAAALTVAGYSTLTLYELLGLRFAGVRLRYARVAPIAFVAYAIGHNVGMNTLSGGAIRYRAYSAIGLTSAQIGAVVAFGTLTFGLGAGLLVGISLLTQAGVSNSILHMRHAFSIAAGALLIGVVLAYIGLSFKHPAALSLGRFKVRLPSTRVAFAQIAVACTDLLLAASVLYVLLPRQAAISFVAFAALYLVSIAAGILSNVPAGVGVFESVLLLLMPAVRPDLLLGAILGYRAIYYLAPFMLALLLLAAHEIWIHRAALVRASGLARGWIRAVTPQAAALAVFAAGAILLFSAATPGVEDRLARLREVIPLSILELSNLLGSAVGVGLLILANGLYRRLDAAWWVAVWLLSAGVVASLLKGFDYEEAIVLAILIAVLLSARSRFDRRASLIDQRFSGPWIVAVVLVFGGAAWLINLAYRHVSYENALWWQFAFEANAPRSLRALLVAALLAGAYGLWRLFLPAPPTIVPLTAQDYALARKLIAENPDTTANLALLGDKNLIFDSDGTAFIMYEISGSSWVAMGDPIGPTAAREHLAWRFFEDCDRAAANPVFYQVTPENLTLYVDMGLSLIKLGEEARVDLRDFSLEGAERADLRQTHRRALRDGASFAVVARENLADVLPEIRKVSDEWLAARNTAEKGFSLGYFDEQYLMNFECAVVRCAGRIVAFANLWQSGGQHEMSIDLMRHSQSAPKGVVDFLLIECMLRSKSLGFAWFNLGMAPLAGLEAHPLAPAWHKLGRLVQRYGATFYNFEGLRKFKGKFGPVWRPRYLAGPGGLAMAGALLDVTALISGGVTKVLSK